MVVFIELTSIREFLRHKLGQLGQHNLVTKLALTLFHKRIFHTAFGHIRIN
jgi:hypothetical protein